MTDYKVRFEVFEGPLDLLLYLIKKQEVDIYDVNLTQLATQFIQYVEVMRQLDLEIAGEFLVMASTLMYIKSREMLPVDQQVTVEGEEEGEDPRWELIRQLVEYKKFKDAAAQLQALEVRQERVYPRLPVKPEFESEAPLRANVSLFDLVNAVSAVLRRVSEREDLRDIFEDKWTVSEKIEYLLRLTAGRAVVRFSALFEAVTSRSEVVCTFLALLELMRLRQLVALQREPFGEIEISRAPEPPPAPPAAGAGVPAAGHTAATPHNGDSQAPAAPGEAP
jgi:segregation and condensation protein A